MLCTVCYVYITLCYGCKTCYALCYTCQTIWFTCVAYLSCYICLTWKAQFHLQHRHFYLHLWKLVENRELQDPFMTLNNYVVITCFLSLKGLNNNTIKHEITWNWLIWDCCPLWPQCDWLYFMLFWLSWLSDPLIPTRLSIINFSNYSSLL